jgi:probable phosphoglycerate mutase
MRIFLVRHGQTSFNVEKRIQGRKPVPLNRNGRAQAKRAGNQLKKISFDCVYFSPLIRAIQTTEAITKYHTAKKVKANWLSERNFGKIEGMTHKELVKIIPDVDQQWRRKGIDWRPPGGETARELQIRSIKNFNKCVKKHKLDETILMVSHGGTIRSIVHHLHGGKPEDIFHTSAPENAEIVEIHYDGKKFKIKRKPTVK